MTATDTANQTADTPNNFVYHLDQGNQSASLISGRKLLTDFNEQQFIKFDQGEAVSTLLTERTSFIDQLLKKIWFHFFSKNDSEKLSLIAIGGYGRGELQPYSDIDLLILSEQAENYQSKISDFITYLWDMGFEVGHAVRTLEQCIQDGKSDITTATSLLESRWLTGCFDSFLSLQNVFNLKSFWPSHAFFTAKLEEQKARHKRYHNTLHQLEPNIKESPGGLRDIQTILWVAKRHFGADTLQELLQHNFISLKEFKEIQSAYHYLNRIRFALHRLKKRNENRLLFDHQQQLATPVYTDDETEVDMVKSVEAYMKPYYQKVHIIARLNEILLQHFREDIYHFEEDHIQQINPRFRLVNQYLDVIKENLFVKNPTALLEVFIIIENYDQMIEGIRSRTIRLIRDNLHLIDDQFRSDPINKALFIELFRQRKGVNAALKRMYAYGILGAYLPAFQKITGLMQFNIFHAYTVDEHTMLVIRNLRRFFIKKFAYEFPTAHQVSQQLCKPEILLLAGLFHDIAKGRNGAHEKLGAVDAKEFAHKHNLNKNDSELLSWLVLRHLDFSYVAQKKDLSDPQVIQQFAKKVGSQARLDHLYLLTLADVRSTSEEVWNDWKNQLFLQLYNNTSKALDATSNQPKDRIKQAIYNKEKASEQLKKRGLSPSEFQSFWHAFEKTDFFNRQSVAEIARITRGLYDKNHDAINIQVQPTTSRGATEIIIFMHDRDYLFAQFSQILDKLNLNIVEAKIYSGEDDMTLVIIYCLDADSKSITDESVLNDIEETLKYQLYLTEDFLPSSQPEPRRIRCFETPTEISFDTLTDQLIELTIHTKDIPGLLAKIGMAFRQCQIRVYDAKINTVGEKAEDTFIISSTNEDSLHLRHKQMELQDALLEAIEF
ncbi:[protein-PII] uridylyltransferase [Hydrogenovibrio sp. SC-1]|uniref:[protein-PII] uridylyltransferase n=1 Tax=Hydrogenovibrio sp. SC-1 TaxID=2065820 RepID=UPI000C7DACBF|nr:[protein-PII] uridylyltransferase [Hydrogenovibrio sp. SC-1]PLA73822.1 [protein-PII] uridylyltransferase [Hydrogenovibrio sp. SC-1]